MRRRSIPWASALRPSATLAITVCGPRTRGGFPPSVPGRGRSPPPARGAGAADRRHAGPRHGGGGGVTALDVTRVAHSCHLIRVGGGGAHRPLVHLQRPPTTPARPSPARSEQLPRPGRGRGHPRALRPLRPGCLPRVTTTSACPVDLVPAPSWRRPASAASPTSARWSPGRRDRGRRPHRHRGARQARRARGDLRAAGRASARVWFGGDTLRIPELEEIRRPLRAARPRPAPHERALRPGGGRPAGGDERRRGSAAGGRAPPRPSRCPTTSPSPAAGSATG